MKKMSWKTWGIIVLGILFGISVFKGCEKDKEYKKLQVKLEEATKIKDSLGNVIYVKDAEIVENQESMKDLRERLFKTEDKLNKKVKEVKALIAQGTKVELVDKLVPYEDTVKMKKWGDSITNSCRSVIKFYEDSSVLIGKVAKDSNSHYNLSVTIQKQGININKLSFTDSQYISVTEFKAGLFKRNTKGKLRFYEPRRVKIEIKHTNPYFQNTGVDGYFYQEPKKNNFLKGVVTGGILTIAGILIL